MGQKQYLKNKFELSRTDERQQDTDSRNLTNPRINCRTPKIQEVIKAARLEVRRRVLFP